MQSYIIAQFDHFPVIVNMENKKFSRVRCYAFTINNHTSDDIAQMTSVFGWDSCSEYAAQEEIGEKSKTLHINGYVYFPKKISISSLRSAMPRAYIRAGKKCALANRRYCTKSKTRKPDGLSWCSHPKNANTTDSLLPVVPLPARYWIGVTPRTPDRVCIFHDGRLLHTTLTQLKMYIEIGLVDPRWSEYLK